MDVPEELQSRYLDRRKKDLEICLLSLQEEKFKDLEKVGHQLKGNASTYGYEELSKIGSEMELAAHKENLSELEQALRNFSHWVNEHSHKVS